MINLMVIKYQNYKCTFLLKYSQIGCAYFVWWARTVYLHSVIKKSIAIGTNLPIKYETTVNLLKQLSL